MRAASVRLISGDIDRDLGDRVNAYGERVIDERHVEFGSGEAVNCSGARDHHTNCP